MNQHTGGKALLMLCCVVAFIPGFYQAFTAKDWWGIAVLMMLLSITGMLALKRD
jgi:hypothetical protein